MCHTFVSTTKTFFFFFFPCGWIFARRTLLAVDVFSTCLFRALNSPLQLPICIAVSCKIYTWNHIARCVTDTPMSRIIEEMKHRSCVTSHRQNCRAMQPRRATSIFHRWQAASTLTPVLCSSRAGRFIRSSGTTRCHH